jgi:hypothetical protein
LSARGQIDAMKRPVRLACATGRLRILPHLLASPRGARRSRWLATVPVRTGSRTLAEPKRALSELRANGVDDPSRMASLQSWRSKRTKRCMSPRGVLNYRRRPNGTSGRCGMRAIHSVSGRWRKLPTADTLAETLAGPELPCDLFRSAGAAADIAAPVSEAPRSARMRQPVGEERARRSRFKDRTPSGTCPVA